MRKRNLFSWLYFSALILLSPSFLLSSLLTSLLRCLPHHHSETAPVWVHSDAHIAEAHASPQVISFVLSQQPWAQEITILIHFSNLASRTLLFSGIIPILLDIFLVGKCRTLITQKPKCSLIVGKFLEDFKSENDWFRAGYLDSLS